MNRFASTLRSCVDLTRNELNRIGNFCNRRGLLRGINAQFLRTCRNLHRSIIDLRHSHTDLTHRVIQFLADPGQRIKNLNIISLILLRTSAIHAVVTAAHFTELITNIIYDLSQVICYSTECIGQFTDFVIGMQNIFCLTQITITHFCSNHRCTIQGTKDTRDCEYRNSNQKGNTHNNGRYKKHHIGSCLIGDLLSIIVATHNSNNIPLRIKKRNIARDQNAVISIIYGGVKNFLAVKGGSQNAKVLFKQRTNRFLSIRINAVVNIDTVCCQRIRI